MAEPNVNFYKGNTNTINSVPITDGNILFDTDKRDISVDNGTTRERFAGGNLSDTDIINDLTSTDTDKPLSANMGKELKDEIGNTSSLTTSSKVVVSAINELNNNLQSKVDTTTYTSGMATKNKVTFEVIAASAMCTANTTTIIPSPRGWVSGRCSFIGLRGENITGVAICTPTPSGMCVVQSIVTQKITAEWLKAIVS